MPRLGRQHQCRRWDHAPTAASSPQSHRWRGQFRWRRWWWKCRRRTVQRRPDVALPDWCRWSRKRCPVRRCLCKARMKQKIFCILISKLTTNTNSDKKLTKCKKGDTCYMIWQAERFWDGQKRGTETEEEESKCVIWIRLGQFRKLKSFSTHKSSATLPMVTKSMKRMQMRANMASGWR